MYFDYTFTEHLIIKYSPQTENDRMSSVDSQHIEEDIRDLELYTL